jgi:hypothetical protein
MDNNNNANSQDTDNNNANSQDTDYESITLETRIRDYVLTNKPFVHILTHCPEQTCHVQYTLSLMHSIELCKRVGIQLKIEFEKKEKNVSRAKNNMIARAMDNPEMTHIFMVDQNVQWNALDMLKLLIGDKPIIAGTPPIEHYNWSRIANDTDIVNKIISKKNSQSLLKEMSPEFLLQCNMLEYNVKFKSNTLSVNNNLVDVKMVSTAFMMVQKNVIEQMMKSFPSQKYKGKFDKDTQVQSYIYSVFNTTVENDEYIPEDVVFCTKWENLKGKLYIDISIPLTTVNKEEYNGSFLVSVFNS